METSAPSTASEPSARRESGGPWAMPLVLFAALAITASLLAVFRQKSGEPANHPSVTSSNTETWTPAPPPESNTVSLTIDFGNGASREFAAIAWSEDMTVGDLLRAARDFGPGIAFTQQGQGRMAFLTSLDGVANQPSNGLFWLYEIDGRRAQVSFEVQPLTPGQRVLWAFKQPD
jgi:hypothetical protein